MLIALDIGATNTRIGLFQNVSKLNLLKYSVYKSNELSSFSDAFNAFLKNENVLLKDIKAISISAAGPIQDNICKLTNLSWKIDINEIKTKLKLKNVFLVNDLQAAGFGIDYLEDKDFFVLNSGEINQNKNYCILSAGTGLGEAFIYKAHEKIVIATEGGHTDFASVNDIQQKLFLFLQKKYGHVSYERILSGQGLTDLYEFFKENKSLEKNNLNFLMIEKEIKKNKELQKVITEMAINKTNKIAEEILDEFISVYGAEAGNLVLKYLALGGIYLGGGIAPKIIKRLIDGSFLNSFCSKGRFSNLLKTVPIKIILEDKVALYGAYHIAIKNQKI